MTQLGKLFEKLEVCNQNRLQANFVFEAEAILSEIYKIGDPSCIAHLIGYLRDDDKVLEFLWSIVHLVEAFPSDLYTKELLATMPKFHILAPDWAETLHARIFNSLGATTSYMKALAKSNSSQRQEISVIIGKLIEESGDFEQKTKPVKMLIEALDSKKN